MALALRGKYGAFAAAETAGTRHLRELREAGLTHVHLLPAYDFATVPEQAENQMKVEVSDRKVQEGIEPWDRLRLSVCCLVYLLIFLDAIYSSDLI